MGLSYQSAGVWAPGEGWYRKADGTWEEAQFWTQQGGVWREAQNVYPNTQLAGGAPSGPSNGGQNNPPTGHTIPFNTGDSRPVLLDSGLWGWETNYNETSSRTALNKELATIPNLQVGAVYRFAVNTQGSRSYTAALTLSNATNITVLDSFRVSGTDVRVNYYDFSVDSPAYSANLRMGSGTTANNTVRVTIFNPRISRIR